MKVSSRASRGPKPAEMQLADVATDLRLLMVEAPSVHLPSNRRRAPDRNRVVGSPCLRTTPSRGWRRPPRWRQRGRQSCRGPRPRRASPPPDGGEQRQAQPRRERAPRRGTPQRRRRQAEAMASTATACVGRTARRTPWGWWRRPPRRSPQRRPSERPARRAVSRRPPACGDPAVPVSLVSAPFLRGALQGIARTGYRPGWNASLSFGRPYVGGYYTDRSYGYYSPAPGFAYGSLRIVDAPHDARVFVDGYYAGVVDEYDGVSDA